MWTMWMVGAVAAGCVGPDAELCAQVEAVAASLEDRQGGPVVHDGAAAALRPARVVARFAAVEAAVAPECSVVGWAAGTYAGRQGRGASGRFDGDSWAGLISGEFVEPAKAWTALPAAWRGLPRGVSGDGEGGPVGAEFSGFGANGQWLVDTEGGAWAGHWVRTKGTNGVFYGVALECGVSAKPPLRRWTQIAISHEKRAFGAALFVSPGGVDATVSLGAPFAEGVTGFRLAFEAPDGTRVEEERQFGQPDVTLTEKLSVSASWTLDTTGAVGVEVVEKAEDGSILGTYACDVPPGGTCTTTGPDGGPRTLVRDDLTNGLTLTAKLQDATAVPATFVVTAGGVLLPVEPGDLGFRIDGQSVLDGLSAVCPDWSCGGGTITWTAELLGADGTGRGTTGGTLQAMEADQFGEILIDGVVWEVE